MTISVADVIAFPRGGRASVQPRHRAAWGTARRSRLDRVVSALLTVILVGGLVAFAGLALGPRILGYRTATMLTGSMAGTIDPGDVIVSVPKPAAEVEVGDILTFHAPVPDQHVETHRVITVKHTADGRTIIRTQGDANAEPDPWKATITGDTVWETVHVIPNIGNAVRVLRTPVVRHGLFWLALGGLVVLGSSLIWARDENGTSDDPRPEALDGAALEQLAEDVEDAAYPATFAARYQELLPRRLDRISTALGSSEHADLDAALEASLSLKVASTTVGARELEELAGVIELSVRRHDVAAARSLADGLPYAGRRADRALATYLAERHAG
ncbi:signal peptidase I [Nocardioides sp.]|uniref:signal peptidase I n=1 Tax=Nocardioides sp. TaxID=35761 RepID=UPI0025F50DEC|nr:signal peptidase I [Nocardioides sp.]